MNVVQARSVMTAASRCRVATRQQRLEEVVHLLAIGNAPERAVLPSETHARIEHDGHKKAGLTLREAHELDRATPLLPGHSRSSSASRTSDDRPPPRPVRPPTRPPPARYRVNPARAFAAACAPR